MDQGISTAAIAAICSGLTALVTALFVRGGPAVVAWWNRSDELERMRTSQAKEGPLMVIARLELELGETKAEVKELVSEIRAIRSEHSNCQVELAGIRAELKHERAEKESLRNEVAELREQIKSQVGAWKLMKQDVQAVQDHQEQQGK